MNIIRKFILLTGFLPFTLMGASNLETESLRLARHYLDAGELRVVKSFNSVCIIEGKGDRGFAIFSRRGDNDIRLAGYSKSGSWDENKLPPFLTEWTRHLEELSPTTMTRNGSVNEYIPDPDRSSIDPLLTSHWHQESPYNDLAPVITDGNKKTVAGCVAIAAAQVIYYWRNDNPEFTLEDTPVYPYGKAPVTMSIPKGSPNNWELMKDSYTPEDSEESRYAAAQLCYVIGTTSYLDFGSSTGGNTYDTTNTIYRQFRITSDYITKSKLEQADWDQLLYDELAQERPVIYSGTSVGGGHAFVVDGYDNETGFYHINFGWGGSGDGYYPIDDSEDSAGGYFQNQSIVYNILPKERNITSSLKLYRTMSEDYVTVSITIKNSSTLDLKNLRLYVVPKEEAESWKEKSLPAWEYDDKVAADGEHKQILVRQLELPLGRDEFIIYLTDEKDEVLNSTELNRISGITSLPDDYDPKEIRIYDLNGLEVKNPSSGIYIIKEGVSTKKIYIK
ncbi:MAG: C10 family peptidase [Muribaculaceae bacterium]|nr:C10 family peptidase [Muribaculaceae bacterium]